MESDHRIAIRGNSLTIDEMYFRIDEIHFVDVTRQDYPIIRQLFMLGAGFGTLLGLPLLYFPRIGISLLLLALIDFCIACSFRRRHALRIGQHMGSTKVIISTDREELERIRQRIIGALESRIDR